MDKITQKDFDDITRYTYKGGLDYVNACEENEDHVFVFVDHKVTDKGGKLAVVALHAIKNGNVVGKMVSLPFARYRNEHEVSCLLAKIQLLGYKHNLSTKFVTDTQMCHRISDFRPDVIANKQVLRQFVDTIKLKEKKLGDDMEEFTFEQLGLDVPDHLYLDGAYVGVDDEGYVCVFSSSPAAYDLDSNPADMSTKEGDWSVDEGTFHYLTNPRQRVTPSVLAGCAHWTQQVFKIKKR